MIRPIRICSVKGCDNKHKSNGYCSKHIQAWRKYGDPLGRVDPEETKRKQSKPKSKEHRANLSKTVKAQYDAGERVSPMKGRQHTQEAKDKVRKANLGKPSWNKGKKTPESVTQKMSKTRLERIAQGKIISSRKGKTHTPEANEKNRIAHLGKKGTEESKNNMRIAQNKPETLEKNRIRGTFQKPTKGPTVPQKLIQKMLESIEVKFEMEYPIKEPPCRPDFFIKPNICIFADGDRWHANPKPYVIPSRTSTIQSGFNANQIIRKRKNGNHLLVKDIWKKDKKITKELKGNGYKVLRFWHSYIENHPEECINEILKCVKKT
jgi:G:T-mismatch repair DNA endonuclease (very short patch repair protein)